ncbi:conserved hypothetical protein [Formosa agariphila KMM 3901]|uniref:MnmC-like methyltransferase domain-containing protein n=1 Tax=Formosa agariphila (strain DSM 15362 / KCTC 12365 / LMG 23005 / KMM 3901 / M-2Alg 35-1) TaxID=1347342 RepID=T2KJ24_FORAG|nr:tRNA (5-methylaminomethyl-2-thiouridine)(34)-methyltransferase MnmD [Formosa agariphila]CDF78438.1 conserved hypothetical protein [Formosa agariphila KMM 3901]
MERKIITTADGSSTIYLPDLDETYHSRHGAIQEAIHVFIKSGLEFWLSKNPESHHLNILEIGFGTGLNAFLTCLQAEELQCNIAYTGVEAYPVSQADLEHINYANEISSGTQESVFKKLHAVDWEILQDITSRFKILKQEKTFADITDEAIHDLIYFDAFGPRVQPELWGESVFNIMIKALKPGGILVTYSAQGNARRAMQAVGFLVERIPGPPGKREMLRARKPF